MTALLFVLGCEVLWITPQMYRENFQDTVELNEDRDADGYTVGEGDCNDSDPEVNPEQLELYGNGIDDNCDGVIDPGNGTSYFSFYAGYNPNLHPYWQLYNRPAPEEPAFSQFLLPQYDWEVTFLMVEPPKTELVQDATGNGDAVYLLFAREEVVLGYRPFGESQMEVLLIFQPLQEDWLYFRLLVDDIALDDNSILTIQYLGSAMLSGDDCTSESPKIAVFLDNIEAPSQALGLVGPNDALDPCRFSDETPIAFGYQAADIPGLQAFDGAIDDLVVVEQGLDLSQREMIIDQIRFPPSGGASASYERPEGIEMMWQTVDAHDNSCVIGFVDEDGMVNASWENCSEGAIETIEAQQ